MNQTFLGLDDCHDDIVGRRGYAQFGAQTTDRAIDGVDFATPPGQRIEQHGWTRIGNLAPQALHMGNGIGNRSEEHTSELQSLMRISYAVFCLKKKNTNMDRNKTTATT